jgi:Bacterial membrane protein YfhO
VIFSSPSPARRPWAPALGCYALIALLLTAPALAGRGSFGADTLLDSDPLYATGPFAPPPAIYDYSPIVLDYPRDLAFARGLHGGRLDLWNPLVACGTPLWAEQGGPFFPLELPFYLFPMRATYHLFLALRLVLAAFGAFALGRAYGLSTIGAFAAGASFELSGASIAQLAFGSASATYVLPWVMLGAHALARRPAFRSAAGAAVALGLAGQAGHPMLALLVFAAFGAAVMGHVLAAWRRPGAALAIGAWACVALLLGLGLAAPKLLPLAELAGVGHTYKYEAAGARIRETTLGYVRQSLPIALFAPGRIDVASRVFGALGPFGAAVGLTALTAAVAGVLCGALNPGLTALLVLGVALALSPPGLGWIGRLPGISLILPAYAPSLIALVLAEAAGRGVQAAGTPRERRALLAGLLVALLGVLALLPIASQLARWPMLAVMALAAVAPSLGLVRLLLPPALALLAVVACAALWHRGAGRSAPAVLALVIVVEQSINMIPLTYQPASNVLTSPPSPAVRFLQERLAAGEGRMLGVPIRIGFPDTPMLFDLPDARSVAALAVGRFTDYLKLSDPKSVSTTLHAPRVTGSPLLDLAAVRYVVSTAARKDDAAAPPAYRDARVTIVENRAALARARIVHESTAAAGREAALRWLKSAAAAGRHTGDGELARKVVLEAAANGAAPPLLSGGPAPGENVRITDASNPDRLLLEARLAEPGLVVIADTYYPGWKATVDGKPAPIYPADVLFRAVYVEPGAHEIELRYEPASFRYGLLLCAAASLICLVALTRRRRGTPDS